MKIMKKEYKSPSVSIEMFTIEAILLEGSWNGEGEDGDDGDRAQSPGRGEEQPLRFRDPGFGSLW